MRLKQRWEPSVTFPEHSKRAISDWELPSQGRLCLFSLLLNGREEFSRASGTGHFITNNDASLPAVRMWEERESLNLHSVCQGNLEMHGMESIGEKQADLLRSSVGQRNMSNTHMMHVGVHTHLYSHTNIHTSTRTYICIHACLGTYSFVCVCMPTCIHMSTHISKC